MHHRIAQQVHQDLQSLVTIHEYGRDVVELPHDFDAMPDHPRASSCSASSSSVGGSLSEMPAAVA